MNNFPHHPPHNYSYSFVPFKRNLITILIHNHSQFSYKTESPITSIWGFYDTKKNKYYSPINSKTVGKEVDIDQTTPYTAMIPRRTTLENCFV